ncbi:MAG TPA: HhH-GPD-type base excision DNA repair protein [Verrucomicrobiae bacterium]|nr:HhH-GPD-type base excision DNA repair protein [Verrucomicrobiae bacterium]
MTGSPGAVHPPGAAPSQLPFTGDEGADRLLARDPFALLVGFALDQQVPLQTAFRGPWLLRQRLGTLDPTAIAQRPAEDLRLAFAGPPAIHRFPQMMATRVGLLAEMVAREHGGRAERVWLGAVDGADLGRRLAALPGFGPMKVRTLATLLGRQFGVRPSGWEALVPSHPTLGDVTSWEQLLAYQAGKRAEKAARRADTTGSRTRHKLPPGAKAR